MFGFSLQKLLVLVGIVTAVWYAFRLVGQMADARKGGNEPKGAARVAEAVRKRWAGRKRAPPREVEDMEQCRRCGSFVARGAGPCERPGCPY
jgi:hypothetical protein